MTTLPPKQFITSITLSICLLVLIIRLVQKGRLDISYCWLWLFIGAGIMLIVIRYDWLVRISSLIGAVTNTTTLFLLAFFVLLLMCLQFSLVISHHRRQIKKLSQELATASFRRPAKNADSKTNKTPSSAPDSSS